MPAHLTSIGNADITRDTRRLGLMVQCRGQPALCRSRVPSGYGNRCAARYPTSHEASRGGDMSPRSVSAQRSLTTSAGWRGRRGRRLQTDSRGRPTCPVWAWGADAFDQAVDDLTTATVGIRQRWAVWSLDGHFTVVTVNLCPLCQLCHFLSWVWAKGEKELQGPYLCSAPQSRDTAQDDQRRRFQAAEKLSRLKLCREIAAATLEQ